MHSPSVPVLVGGGAFLWASHPCTDQPSSVSKTAPVSSAVSSAPIKCTDVTGPWEGAFSCKWDTPEHVAQLDFIWKLTSFLKIGQRNILHKEISRGRVPTCVKMFFIGRCFSSDPGEIVWARFGNDASFQMVWCMETLQGYLAHKKRFW